MHVTKQLMYPCRCSAHSSHSMLGRELGLFANEKSAATNSMYSKRRLNYTENHIAWKAHNWPQATFLNEKNLFIGRLLQSLLLFCRS